MKPVTSTAHFNAPQSAVWAVVSDVGGAADRLEAVTKSEIVTPGPLGKGTRFRETRVMFGREHTEEMEITRWDPPRSYTVECESCGCHYTSDIVCTPEGNGTRVEMSFHAEGRTVMAKVMGAIMGRMMSKACAKAFQKDLEDLRKSIEQGSAGAPQPTPA